MKNLYIISTTSRGANYGVGTYIKQLEEALINTSFKINIINLYSYDQAEPCVEEVDGVRYFKICSPREGVGNAKDSIRYYRNVYCFLKTYIDEGDETIFHFHFMQAGELARLLKKNIKCKIVLTVHYMDWSFELLGDVNQLKKIIETPVDKRESAIKKSFENEKFFIDEYVDHVISIAEHSHETLLSIYGIAPSKVTRISNGLKDKGVVRSKNNRSKIKNEFKFSENEFVLIFAGRLDEVKGLSYLLKAFSLVLSQNDNVRLVIAGDGAFRKCFEDSCPCWSKISYTGFVTKENLYKLYSISDLGVVPSLHEEFGYVAIEMMMNGLPILVNNTTGLSEIVTDGVNGACISIENDADHLDRSIKMLSDKILQLIDDEALRKKYSKNGRRSFRAKYDQGLFKNRILELYESIIQ